ncbi:MAG TPA: cache domain-containing protein, partial [Stellaceae bacterium]
MTIAQSPDGRVRRMIRLIQALVVMSVLVPAIGIGLAAWQDRRAIVSDAEQDVEQSVNILHEHTLKVFEIHELILDKIAMRTDGLDWASIAESPATSEFLRQVIANVNYISSIWLIDADGKVRATSNQSQNIAGLTVADREYFRAERDTDVTTFISKPYIGRLSGQPLFGVARRRSTGTGAFDGVICISVPVEYFERLFRSVEPDERHRIVLVRDDGEVLASDPPPPNEVTHFPENSLLMRAVASGRQSHSWQVSPMDGREHFFSWRKLGGYPLYVAYAIDKDVALQPWYEHLRLYGAVGIGAALALFLASLLALRYARRELALVRRVTEEADGRVRAETSLQQVRKLEAVGQLTGGVAHDFNNLLTTILGNAERAQHMEQRAKQLQCLKNIEHAASNGARLVHHLLAFARKQHLDPQPTGINQIVVELAEMLESTIGSRIRVSVELDPAPWLAMADASQIETAILNIALNARDAMPQGGHLTITTANLAAADPRRLQELEPG